MTDDSEPQQPTAPGTAAPDGTAPDATAPDAGAPDATAPPTAIVSAAPPAPIDLSPDANPAADRSYETSRWWRRRFLRTAALLGGYWLILIWLAAAGVGSQVLLIGLLAVASLAGRYRQHARRSLTIGAGGVSYSESTSLSIHSTWSNVERIVLLGRRPTSVALLLREPGLIAQLRRRPFDSLRNTAYPFARTIPLEPFFDAIRGPEIQARLLFLAPELFGPPPTRLERPPSRLRARVVGLAIILLPVVAAIGAVVYARLTDTLPNSTRLQIGFGLITSIVVTPILLLRNWGRTGERLADAMGRILLRPARGESRLTALAPGVVLYVAVVALSLVGGNRLLSTTGSASCVPANFTGQAPALGEPQWPGHPHGSITVPLGVGWSVTPLTEDGLAQAMSRETAAFAANYTKSVRGYIRNGLVMLALQRWPAGGVTTLYVYELSCDNAPLNGDLSLPADHPALGGPTGVTGETRFHMWLGLHEVFHSAYHEVENNLPVTFDIYEWTEADSRHFFRLVARTDGTADPHESVEQALTILHDPSYVYPSPTTP